MASQKVHSIASVDVIEVVTPADLVEIERRLLQTLMTYVDQHYQSLRDDLRVMVERIEAIEKRVKGG